MMTLSQIREMKSRMSSIEALEDDGRWAEADLLWDEMFRTASSGGMRREAIAGAGKLAELFKWMLPMWREEIGGSSRFVNPGKELGGILRHRYAPLWSTLGKKEVPIKFPEALKHLIVDLGMKEEKAYRMLMEPGDAMAFKNLLDGGAPFDQALNIISRGGKDYENMVIHAPGGKQVLTKGLIRKVGLPTGGLVAFDAMYGPDRLEGGPTPDRPYDPRPRRYPRTPESPRPGYYPRHRYPSETSPGGYGSVPRSDSPPEEYVGYQSDDTPYVPQWEQGSVAGVVMDPYGRRVIQTIPRGQTS